MVKKFIENGYAEVIKILGIFLTASTMIVGITLFIADRPTRAEVKDTIDSRLKPIENQINEITKRQETFIMSLSKIPITNKKGSLCSKEHLRMS